MEKNFSRFSNERRDAGGKVDIAARKMPRSRRLDSVSVAAIRSFVSVVDLGGFSRAAKDLGIAVSTVSKHIEVLEERLQTTILNRSTRRITLSDAGYLFYENCRLVMERLDDAAQKSLSRTVLGGRLRVVAPPSFTSCILSPALPAFLAMHPELRVELSVTTADVDFLKDGIDLAIRMLPPNNVGDHIDLIGEVHSLLCAAPSYLDNYGVPKLPSDLERHRCLGGINSPYGELWQFKIDGKIINLPVKCMFLTDTGDVLKHACLNGLGIAGFYNYHIKDDVLAGNVIPVLTEYRAAVSSIFIVRPLSRYPSAACEAFTEFVREICHQKLCL